MKSWITPETIELNITSTEHRILGNHLDGGYVGDGVISGHQTFNEDKCVGKVGNKVCTTCYPNGYPGDVELSS